MFLRDYLQVMRLGQEYFLNNIVSFLVHSLKRHVTSVHPVIGDVNVDHLIEVVFAKIFQILGFWFVFKFSLVEQIERNGGGQNGGLDSIWVRDDGDFVREVTLICPKHSTY